MVACPNFMVAITVVIMERGYRCSYENGQATHHSNESAWFNYSSPDITEDLRSFRVNLSSIRVAKHRRA